MSVSDSESGRPAVYVVRVGGELGRQWSEWFPGLRLTSTEDGETQLTGVVDQTALHGVLRRVRDLGLPLVSVSRTTVDRDGSPIDLENREAPE